MTFPRQADVLAGRSIYGNPKGVGGGNASPKWEASQLVRIPAPWPMTMGEIRITSFRMHRECALSLVRVFDGIRVAAKGKKETLELWGVTKFGGGFNYRLMRGGTSLSMHSYGCAIDLDPQNNGMRDRTPRFSNYPEVLKAFKNEGWLWGGDWNGNDSTADERSCDGMHWQATCR